MASYCNIGDIARVTLPDGGIRDFTDTSISISFEESYPDCAVVTIYFTYSYYHSYRREIISRSGYSSVRAPVSGLRINPNRNDWLEAYCRGRATPGFPCYPPNWFKIGDLSGGDYYVSVSDIENISSTDEPERRLIITGYSGTTLYNEIVESDDYSVECIKSCPEGTIDCGDCCLPCEPTVNSVVDLRMLVASLR
ncbi:MAG: hypothetical protein QNJ47_09620 [Nostocaceae cyanobacterium]|nr:hypothetical protein [Nostocaceae cyanobacterium]